MAESVIPKVIKDGTITLLDGTTPTALEYEIQCEDGTFAIDPGTPETVDVYDRDSLCSSRLGRDAIGTLSFSAHMREFANDTDGTLLDFIEGTGGKYGSGGSTPALNSDTTGAMEGNIRHVKYLAEGTDHGDAHDHQILATKVRLSWSFSEGNPDIINVTGQILGTITRSEA